MTSYAIECKGITKRFGSVLANDKVDLSIKYGEILALLGENGSGKTTLMNMLSGIYHPDEGHVLIDGKPVVINSPTDAFSHGIGMVHQHFKLVDVMTAFENILIGTERERGISLKGLKDKVRELSEKYGLSVNLDKKVYNMSVSEKQSVEILKVLYRGARILVLDEPTAVLTPQEIEKLFQILRKMKRENCAIIIITHKLGEVMSISDRVMIMRKGQSIETVETSAVDEKKLTELMVGRPISLAINRPEVKKESQRVILSVNNLFVNKADGTKGLEAVSFQLKTGEILGVAGVAGSGQKELCEAIVGVIPSQEGSVLFEEQEIMGMETRSIYKLGISFGYVPEDRLGMGLVGSMGMIGNLMLKNYKDAPGIMIDRKPAKATADRLVEELEIKTPSIETPVSRLSGGNIQKVLLGREIESNPKVLMTAYPVRGLDINASYTIYDLLNEQKKKGCGVMFVGEDLDVLLELSDRILVLCQGKVMGIVDAQKTTKEQLGLMMVGEEYKEYEDCMTGRETEV